MLVLLPLLNYQILDDTADNYRSPNHAGDRTSYDIPLILIAGLVPATTRTVQTRPFDPDIQFLMYVRLWYPAMACGSGEGPEGHLS